MLVADIGFWHGSGAKRWRYIVGLKNVSHKLESPIPSLMIMDDVISSIPGVGNFSGVSGQVAAESNTSSASSERLQSATSTLEPTIIGRSTSTQNSGPDSNSAQPSIRVPLSSITEDGFVETPIPKAMFSLLTLFKTWQLGPGPNAFLHTLREGLLRLEKEGHLSQ